MKKLCVFLLLVFIFAIPGVSEARDSVGKFVVVLLDQLSLQEIEQGAGSVLDRLFDENAVALLNVRTDQGIESPYTYTAFGAGSRGEKYGAIPGLLGQLLKEHNYTIAAFGNSDYGYEERREVITIAMDDNGYLFFGDTSQNLLIDDPTFAGGKRTFYEKMGLTLREAYPLHDLFFIEVGDISRIKTGLDREEITAEGAKALVKSTLTRLDNLLKEILGMMDLREDRLMLVAPTPDPKEMRTGSKLSWVVITKLREENRETTSFHDHRSANIKNGANNMSNAIFPFSGAIDSWLSAEPVGGALLTTGTTRRPGLATISDLAPTILAHFLIPIPTVMNGRPLYTLDAQGSSLNQLIRRNEQINRTSEWRPWYIKGFILLQIIVISLATITFLARHLVARKWWRFVSFLLVCIMLVPLIFLLLSPYQVTSYYGYMALLVTLMIGGAWVLLKFFATPLSPINFLVTGTCIALLIDVFRGSPWIARSLLGYCPVIGARFYGIGNEYMGILVGGTLIAWTGLVDRFDWLRRYRLWITPLVFLAVMLVIGFPNLGANFGGILTAMAAFTFTYILMFEKGQRRRIFLVSSLLLCAALGIILLADTYGWTGEQSHLGKTVHLLREEGFSALVNIVWRKFSMNLKLLRWTIWTRVLLTFIIVLALLFKRPKGVLHELVQELPNLALGFVGALLGSVVTMMVNDSGVVAAATLLFFAVFPLLYLILRRVEAGWS